MSAEINESKLSMLCVKKFDVTNYVRELSNLYNSAVSELRSLYFNPKKSKRNYWIFFAFCMGVYLAFEFFHPFRKEIDLLQFSIVFWALALILGLSTRWIYNSEKRKYEKAKKRADDQKSKNCFKLHSLADKYNALIDRLERLDDFVDSYDEDKLYRMQRVYLLLEKIRTELLSDNPNFDLIDESYGSMQNDFILLGLIFDDYARP